MCVHTHTYIFSSSSSCPLVWSLDQVPASPRLPCGCTRPQRHDGMMMLEQKPSDKWKVNVECYHVREGNHRWLCLTYSNEVISMCVQITIEGCRENEVCVLSIFSHLLYHSHYLFCQLIVFIHVINISSFFHPAIVICLYIIYPSIYPTFIHNQSVERLGEGEFNHKVFFLGTCSSVPSIIHI